MRIIAFSDLHCHTHRFGATVNETTGRQSRLTDCLDVLDITQKAAILNDVSIRIFCGDMFHIRGRLTPSVLNPVIEHFEEAHRHTSFLDILIPGNHDLEGRAGESDHALTSLGLINDVLVLDHAEYTEIKRDGKTIGIASVPYDAEVKVMKERVKKLAALARLDTTSDYKIMLIHHGIDGAMDGIPDMGFGPRDLPTDDFDLVLCGDYHTNKELVAGKAWMIGAPLHHNFGDAGQKRGHMLFDLAEKTAELFENPLAPKFVTWAKGQPALSAAGICGNFIRLRHDDETDLDALEVAVIAAGAKAVQKELVKDWAAVTRSDVSLSMTTAQMFRTWLDGQDLPVGIDIDALVKMNDEILAEAGVS